MTTERPHELAPAAPLLPGESALPAGFDSGFLIGLDVFYTSGSEDQPIILPGKITLIHPTGAVTLQIQYSAALATWKNVNYTTARAGSGPALGRWTFRHNVVPNAATYQP